MVTTNSVSLVSDSVYVERTLLSARLSIIHLSLCCVNEVMSVSAMSWHRLHSSLQWPKSKSLNCLGYLLNVTG